ncbi:MAG: CHAT domain-containing protein [Cyanobacteria bacterium P01_F01_bin.53]
MLLHAHRTAWHIIYNQVLKSLARSSIKSSAAILTILSVPQEAVAEILPTTEGTATEVTTLGTPSHEQFNITGGQRSYEGNNLFHSFEQFNLEAGQTANFITNPDIQNIFSQITGQASSIDGRLQILGSEADLYLMNPAGILFGANAQLNLPGSLSATTATAMGFGDQWLNLLVAPTQSTDYTALTGTPTAFDFASAGAVINTGHLAVRPGEALSLIGGTVINTGELSAPGGTLTLTAVEAGNLLRLEQENQLLSLEISSTPRSPVSQTLGEMLTGLGNDYADTLSIDANGEVRLVASNILIPENAGSAIASGTLSTDNETGIGGDINIFGTQVGLIESQLSASGRDGGGTLRIGGDYQGGPAAPTASQTYIDTQSILTADALEQGHGGQIYIWSDDFTQFHGHLSAQGGQLSGNGGFAEISGKQSLIYNGTVELGAPQGTDGEVLFDPYSITIKEGYGEDFTGSETLPNIFTNFFNLLIPFTIYEDTLEQFSSVTLESATDIIIEDLSDNELTFQPGGTIVFKADVNGNGTGSFIMEDRNDTIRTQGGDIEIYGGDPGISLGNIDTRNSQTPSPGGNITLTSRGAVNAGSLNGGDGDIQVVSNGLDFTAGPDSVSASTITIMPTDIESNIQIGGHSNIPGTLNLSVSDLAALSDSLNQINIGRSDGRGRVTLTAAIANGSANPLSSPVTLMGGSESTLVAPDLNNYWTLNDQNSGTISNYSQLNFSGMGTLFGGSEQDTFEFENPTAAVTQAIVGGTGDLTLLGDDLNLPERVSGSGKLTIRPTTATTAIQLGGTGSGESNKLTLTDAELDGLQDGFSSIEIGDDSSGPITLENDINFTDSVTLRSGSSIDASSSMLTGSDNANLTLITNGDIATRDLATAGGDITLTSGGDTRTEELSSDGGDITLTSAGDITTAFLDARSTASVNPTGGDITVTTGNHFQATDSFSGDDGAPTSIATDPGNQIVIQHGGNGAVPFVVGENTTSNGTVGRITDQRVVLNNRELFTSLVEGNISILTEASPPGPADKPAAPDTGNPTGDNPTGGNPARQKIGGTTGEELRGGTTGKIPGGLVSAPPPSNVIPQTTNVTPEPSTGSTTDIIPEPPDPATDIFPEPSVGSVDPPNFSDSRDSGIDVTIEFSSLPETDPLASPVEPLPEQQSRNFNLILRDSNTGLDTVNVTETFNQIEIQLGSQFANHLDLSNGVNLEEVATVDEVQSTLTDAYQALGVRSALVYAYFVPNIADNHATQQTQPSVDQASGQQVSTEEQRLPRDDDQLELMVITPEGNPLRRQPSNATRAQVRESASELRRQATSQFSSSHEYLPPAQQLYSWLVEPLESVLSQQNIDNLAFVMDDGLRTFPLAALHDGQQFLIENFSLGLVPTFSLTNFGLESANSDNSLSRGVLAMGASQFVDQPPLPGVEAELSFISEELDSGEAFFNENFTLENLTKQVESQEYGVVHLATHATFESGDLDNSYIQLWEQRMSLSHLSNLELSQAEIELIILSACNTALGDPQSEYGFAGFAVHAGSQSALASLWPVSDEGTLGFMTQFYDQFTNAPIRAEALREAQLAMVSGQVGIRNGQVYGPNNAVISTIPALADSGYWDFSHPFYWSAFTMIGSPW